MKQYRILAINPGSTSTKVAIYDGRKLLKEITLRHSTEELAGFKRIADQFDFRKRIILDTMKEADIDIASLDAVIGRGGMLKPVDSGIFEVNEAMKADLRASARGEHASNLGGLIASDIAEMLGIPAYIADPVVVDELDDVARIGGLPELERVSIFHALNQKAMARMYAERVGRRYEDLNLIVVHLGGGISVGAHRQGRVVDVNQALDGEGPLSPERAGTLPAGALARMCFSGKYTEEQVLKMITGKGGLVAHLGTNDCRDASRMADEGNAKARLVLDAIAYNTAKYVGAVAAVLKGRVDAIIITGGIANDKKICAYIAEHVGFIAPVEVMPGENELEALAFNALRVLEGETVPKVYV
ncbi:MAG: butyrate kinase [Rikenellaceae bacterium]|nr:butyrate kinase [Rikenellaceae bacterium]MCL2693021.1 butyrate kinase [Rikenellaceae bacterium]